uniref:Solute carrier family 25 member 46 n=1 Tax=Eptatretus burgeri TaxID=7764 RepID=A0A8C4Q4P3_EPTBU
MARPSERNRSWEDYDSEEESDGGELLPKGDGCSRQDTSYEQQRFLSDQPVRPRSLTVVSTDLPIEKPEEPENDNFKRFAGFGVSLLSLFAENVLAHPFIVIRRQCQLNYQAKTYHLTPFTIIRLTYAIGRAQTPKVLWKGIGSTFIHQGLTLGVEGILGEYTALPKDFPMVWNTRMVGAHMLLKGITCLLTMPFYSTSLVDTVQSEMIRDSPSILECIREGCCRALGLGIPHSKRLLPLHLLALPTLTLCLLHYLLAKLVRRLACSILAPRHAVMPFNEAQSIDLHISELAAGLVSNLVADAALLPLEMVVTRLHIQGTRSIVDCTEPGGQPLLPVNTCYEGAGDCIRTALREEGRWGFYRGLGTLGLQYGLHAAVLQAGKVAVGFTAT